jgi:hypothetical protein
MYKYQSKNTTDTKKDNITHSKLLNSSVTDSNTLKWEKCPIKNSEE